MDPNVIRELDKAYALISQAHYRLIDLWVRHIVFSWRWWLVALLDIAAWTAWFFLRKKESTSRLLFAGFIVLILSSWLDFIGVQLGAWSYYVCVDPLSPSYITWDFTLLPIAAMLFLQYKPNANLLLKAVIYSAIGSFIIQPLFEWLGIYNSKGWKDWYSFPILAVIYLTAHFVSRRKGFGELI